MRAITLGCVLLLSTGGAWAQSPPEPPPAASPAPQAREGQSLYQLDARLIDQEGREVRLADFRGQPVLITLFYGTCPHACPLLMARLKRIEAALTPEARAALRVVLVSLDPAHDTPESLKKLSQAHGVDPARWRLLWTREENVQELAAVLGVKYRALPGGGMNHSSVITLLDGEGVIDLRLEGLEQAPDTLVSRLRELTAGPPR